MAKLANTDQFVAEAERLAIEVSARRPPILLRQIATRRRITEVVFCPLLVDALLTTHLSGFRVFFNSSRDESSALLERYKTETRSNLLSSRVRFSLAHEIAHTLYYDLTEGRPKPKEFVPEMVLEDLESVCNYLAGRLLVPSELLKNEVAKLPNLKPETVLNMAGLFGVSPQTLVTRFGEEPGYLLEYDLRGCVVVLLNTKEGLLVKAIARPPRINIPAELRMVMLGEAWQVGGLDWHGELKGKEGGTLTLNLSVETKLSTEKKNCLFWFVRYATSLEGDLLMATVDLS